MMVSKRVIYHLSRVLSDVENRYSPIEKLYLCLYFSCTKLIFYIKPIDVFVYSHYNVIKHMLSKPILHSRMGKQALELNEYSLNYAPLRAIKGQIVSDFIIDHAIVKIKKVLLAYNLGGYTLIVPDINMKLLLQF